MDAPPKQRRLKILLVSGKLALAAVLVALVLRQVQWDGLKSALTAAHWPTLALALLVMFPSSIVAAFRWRMLLSAQGVPLGAMAAAKLAFLGDLFANVLPGTIGGDAVKAFMVARNSQRKGPVWISVLADRGIGLGGLVVLTWIALAFSWGLGFIDSAAAAAPAISLLVISGAMVIALSVLLSATLRRALRLQALYAKPRFVRYAAAAKEAVRTYRAKPAVVAAALLYTLASQALMDFSVGLLGAGIGMNAHWYDYAGKIPLIEIISAIPITPGAAGVWEGAARIYFAAASADSVLAMVLLWRAAMIVCALPGLAVALLGPKLPRFDEEAELGSTGVTQEAVS